MGGGGQRETMEKNIVCRRPAGTHHFDHLIFCEHENRVKICKRPRVIQKFFPIEILFIGNFQSYRKELLKNPFDRKFHTEKLHNGTLNEQVRRYGGISHFIHVWHHKVIKNEKMTAYLLSCRIYKNGPFNLFQYKISDQISYL